MKCPNCGFEINETDVKFCPECGSPVHYIKDTNGNPDNSPEKMKWWYSMPIIWMILCCTIIYFPFFLVGLGLLALRLIKFPNRRKTAIVSFVLPLIFTVSVFIVIVISEYKQKNTIYKSISDHKFEDAIQLINRKYNDKSYEYASLMAEVYHEQKDYDNEARVLTEYIRSNNLNSTDNDFFERLFNIRDVRLIMYLQNCFNCFIESSDKTVVILKQYSILI